MAAAAFATDRASSEADCVTSCFSDLSNPCLDVIIGGEGVSDDASQGKPVPLMCGGGVSGTHGDVPSTCGCRGERRNGQSPDARGPMGPVRGGGVVALLRMRVGKGTAVLSRDREASCSGLRETTLSGGLVLVSASLRGLAPSDKALRTPINSVAMVASVLIGLYEHKLN